MFKKFCNSFRLAAANEVSNEVDACNLVVKLLLKSDRGPTEGTNTKTFHSLLQVKSHNRSAHVHWITISEQQMSSPVDISNSEMFYKKNAFFCNYYCYQAVKLMSFILRLQPRETQSVFQKR